MSEPFVVFLLTHCPAADGEEVARRGAWWCSKLHAWAVSTRVFAEEPKLFDQWKPVRHVVPAATRSGCFRCKKPLHSEIHEPCGTCDWIKCACGACKCNAATAELLPDWRAAGPGLIVSGHPLFPYKLSTTPAEHAALVRWLDSDATLYPDDANVILH
jgi:hypothetical protein